MSKRYFGGIYAYDGEYKGIPDYMENDGHGVTIDEAKSLVMERADNPRHWSLDGIWGFTMRSASFYGRQRTYYYARHRASGTFKQVSGTHFYECVRTLKTRAQYQRVMGRQAATFVEA